MKKIKNKVAGQSLYIDFRSSESTYPFKDKPKYKVTGEKPLFENLVIFLLTTSNLAACNKFYTIKINPHEWGKVCVEDKCHNIYKTPTYIDLNKTSIENISEVLDKLRNKTLRNLRQLPKKLLARMKNEMSSKRNRTINEKKLFIQRCHLVLLILLISEN